MGVPSQIRFILLQNRQGKTRLSKWYIPAPSEQEKFRIESEIHKLIVSRDRKYTNFVEVCPTERKLAHNAIVRFHIQGKE